jgi:hypothetical protein
MLLASRKGWKLTGFSSQGIRKPACISFGFFPE